MKRLQDVRTKSEFINYMKPYGNHVDHCIFDHHSVRKVTEYIYMITFYEQPHRENWYNDSGVGEKECTVEQCLDMIRNEARRQKLKKLKLKILI